MVECGGLENRYPRKGIIGSNPILSAIFPLKNDGTVAAQGRPPTVGEGGFEWSTVYQYDKSHIDSAGGRPEPAGFWQGRAPNPILSAIFPLKNNGVFLFSVVLILCLFPHPVLAEIIQLKNGNSIETKILKEDENFVTVQAPGGKIKIPKSDIETIWRDSKEELMAVRGREVYFAKGAELYKEGKFLEAADSFGQALGGGVLDTIVYANLGSAFASAGEPQIAEEHFLKVLGSPTNNPGILLNAAHFFESEKKFEKAIFAYEKYLSFKPVDLNAKKGLAYCYFNRGDFQKALNVYEDLARQNDLMSNYNAALCCLKLGEVDKAEAFSKKLLENRPPISKGFLIKAEVLEKRNKFSEAEAAYQRFSEIEKKDKEASLRLGFFYLDIEEAEKAQVIFLKVLEKDPENMQARPGLLQAYLLNNNYTDAMSLYNKMLEKDSGNRVLLNGKGLLYLKTNEPQKALEVFQKIFTLDDRYAKAHANAGLAYAFLGDADKAIEKWGRALELDPSLKEAAQNKKLLEDAMRGNKNDNAPKK